MIILTSMFRIVTILYNSILWCCPYVESVVILTNTRVSVYNNILPTMHCTNKPRDSWILHVDHNIIMYILGN